MQTQWRSGGLGGLTGLDYAGVRAHLEETGPPAGPERRALWADLLTLERATLDAWAEQHPKP